MNFEISSGKLRINGAEYSVPNIDLEKVVGQGANGIVVLGQNRYMNRRVAVKIWMLLRQGDRRDKYEQGIREVNKMAEIEDRDIARVYDAGKLGEYFYAVFEFVEGITCKQWHWEYKPNLLTRLNLASSIMHSVFSLYRRGIIHGDLHSENILVMEPNLRYLQHSVIYSPVYKIIDFGTSYFSPEGYSEKRHWNIFKSTIIELLRPFNIQTLWSNKYPHDQIKMYKKEWSSVPVFQWYYTFFEEIPNMIRSFGIDLNADPNDSSKWNSGPSDEAPQYPDENIRNILQDMRSKGELILKPEKIGIIHSD